MNHLQQLIDVLRGSPKYTVYACPQQASLVAEIIAEAALDFIIVLEDSDYVKFGTVHIVTYGTDRTIVKLNQLFNVLELM